MKHLSSLASPIQCHVSIFNAHKTHETPIEIDPIAQEILSREVEARQEHLNHFNLAYKLEIQLECHRLSCAKQA
jgi:hypothetical protein